MLLSLFIGLSVLVPYIGATVMTIPVAVVGYFQFGATSDFVWVMAAYGIIQLVDGNLLAPLLLSEVVNMHPCGDYRCSVGVWRACGVFGGLLCHSTSHAGSVCFEGLAAQLDDHDA